MKNLKKYILIFIIFFSIFACNKKEELVYNISIQPRSLDPHRYSDSISQEIALNVYESLLKLDENGKIKGAMAKEYFKEGNKYIFKIRENLKYSDGENISMEDIKGSFLRILDKKNASQYASMLFVIKNAKPYYEGKVKEDMLGVKIEDNNLIIELEKDITYFPYLMTLPLSVTYKEGKYTGAYKISEVKEQEIYFEKNEYYWDKANVKLDKFKIVYFKDFSVINNLTKNKELDISRVDSDYKGENVKKILNGRIYFLDFNIFKDKNVNNKHLRKAISLAINRDEYVNIVKNDGSIKMLNILSDKIFDYKAKYLIDSYNLNEAQKELNLAKETLGENIEIELLTGNSPIEIKEAQFLQDQISKIGINVKIKTVPFKERLNLIREGNYEVAINTWTPKFADPIAMLDRFLFKKKETKAFDKVKYNNLVEEIRTETKDRLAKINEAEKMLLEDMIISPLYLSVENVYFSDKIKNYSVSPVGGLINLATIELK